MRIPVHNVAHGIGAVLHVPHGEANMVALPVVMGEYAEYYQPYSESEIIDLLPKPVLNTIRQMRELPDEPEVIVF